MSLYIKKLSAYVEISHIVTKVKENYIQVPGTCNTLYVFIMHAGGCINYEHIYVTLHTNESPVKYKYYIKQFYQSLFC